MKRLIVLLLFGLFILGPPGLIYADSDFGNETEMTFNQETDALDYGFVSPEIVSDVYQIREVLIWPPGKLVKSDSEILIASNGLNVFLIAENKVSTESIENRYLKIAGTERMCYTNLIYSTQNAKVKIYNSDIRIRGHDLVKG